MLYLFSFSEDESEDTPHCTPLILTSQVVNEGLHSVASSHSSTRALRHLLECSSGGNLFFLKSLIQRGCSRGVTYNLCPDGSGMQCLFTTSVKQKFAFEFHLDVENSWLGERCAPRQKHKLKRTLLAKNSSRRHDMMQLTDLLRAGTVPAWLNCSFLHFCVDVPKH